MVSQAEFISMGYHSLDLGLISIFLERVWAPLNFEGHAISVLTMDINSRDHMLLIKIVTRNTEINDIGLFKILIHNQGIAVNR